MSMTNKPVEPSMEEILASIRKIIAEEPIGTRPDPVNHHAAKTSPRLDVAAKRSPVPEALAMDDVLDMAGGAGQSPGAGARNGAAKTAGTGGASILGKAAAQTTQAADAKVTSTAAARAEETKTAAPERSADTLGATVPGRKAELDTPPERPAAQNVDTVLADAQKKVDRHFGSLPEPAERPAPLGLRSIRDPLRDVKPANSSLMSRVAATQAAAEAVTDKVRGANGAGGAATATGTPAKQTDTAPEKADGAAAKATAQTMAATAVTPAEPAKAAAGQTKASLEEAVAEMLRPMLNTWLEANLSRIVEQVVREHVAKTPLPGKDKPAA